MTFIAALTAAPEICWLGEGAVEALDQAAPGLRIRRCSVCNTSLCARFVAEGLELRRDDGLRLLRRSPAGLERLGPARTAVFLQSLVLEAELRPRRPAPKRTAAPEPRSVEPRIRVGPVSKVQGPSTRVQRPAPTRVLNARSGTLRLGGGAGLRWRSPGLAGPSLGLDLGWGPLRLHVRGDLPARGRLEGARLDVLGLGGGLGAAWESRAARWTWGLEGGLRWDWLRVRLEDVEGPARADGALLGLGVGLHTAVLVRRLEVGVHAGADAFPGGFELLVEGERSQLPRLNAWGLTSNLSLRWRP